MIGQETIQYQLKTEFEYDEFSIFYFTCNILTSYYLKPLELIVRSSSGGTLQCDIISSIQCDIINWTNTGESFRRY